MASLFDSHIVEYIRVYMTNLFYLEGEEKDYYFGESILNDNLTVFYNPEIIDSLATMDRVIDKAFDKFCERYNFWTIKKERNNLQESAFHIHAFCLTYTYRITDDGEPSQYGINCAEKGVLEESLKKEPERWELYKKLTEGPERWEMIKKQTQKDGG